jgi:hypothetical protein
MKTNYKLSLILILSLLLTLTYGCDDEDEKCQSRDDGFFPLTLNNKWVYQTKDIYTQRTDTVVLQITDSRKMVDNECWFYLEGNPLCINLTICGLGSEIMD